MNQPLPPQIKKPRHRTLAAERAARAGVERRGNLIGTNETRRFDAHVIRSASTRTDAGSNAGQVTGEAITYDVAYEVFDGLGPSGSFTETMAPGVVSQILATADCRLLIDHDSSRLLARTSSGTMSLRDSSTGLQFTADLDPRDTDASNALIRIERGDLSQCSVGFVVANDIWNQDYTSRRVTKIARLDDCSLVTFPASPTTSVELGKKKKPDDDLLWGDGTQGGSGQTPSGLQDGTGSRGKSQALELELELLSLRHRKPSKPRRLKLDPYHGVR